MECGTLFEITIESTEYGEWQGTVLFPDSEKEYKFQSFLELLRIVDESISDGKETAQ